MILDDVYPELIQIVSTIGAQVDVPIEAEEFFAEIISNFEGTKQELLTFVESQIRTWFQSLSDPPAWIQEAEWQFDGGRPMIFVGQINVAAGTLFHDDAAFFLFFSPQSGITKSIVQVA
jgi:hypothetical protein